MLITGVHAHAFRSYKGLTTGETGWLGEVLCEAAELGLGGCRFLPQPQPTAVAQLTPTTACWPPDYLWRTCYV